MQDLIVTFSREGEVEHTGIAANGDRALIIALQFILRQDALRAGDKVSVEWHKPPTLVDRGLA